jgi:hypothetical protein
MCPFSWTKKGIVECFDPDLRNVAALNSSLKQTIHLMVHDPLGLRPFHSSLLVFVRSQADYALYEQVVKPSALTWLKTKAPAFQRWAYEWLLEAEFDNNVPLIDGPNREWAVNAIVNRYPKSEGSELLARSGWSALAAKDLPRYVEVGLLRDYFNSAHGYRSEYMDALLPAQLLLEVDSPHLQLRLESSLPELRLKEIAALARREAALGNQAVVKKCFNELNRRLSRPDEEERNWRKRVVITLEIASYVDDLDPGRVASYASKLQEPQKLNDYGYHFEALQAYTQGLRVRKQVGQLRTLLSQGLPPPASWLIFRSIILVGFEENIDLRADTLSLPAQSDPFAAICAFLNNIDSYQIGTINLTDFGLLKIKPYEHSEHRVFIADLFYHLFFCFLANHIWQRGTLNLDWLSHLDRDSWHGKSLHLLDSIADEWAKAMRAKSVFSLSWLYERLQVLPRPEYSDDRQGNEYAIGFETACYRISLDLFLLCTPAGSTISKTDLSVCLKCEYFLPWAWLKAYAAYNRPWLAEEAAQWILEELSNQLETSISIFTDRVEQFSLLAFIGALHGLKDLAHWYLKESAANLLSYGEHKDLLLFEALDVISASYKAGIPDAPKWLLRLAGAIDTVKEFTDGDETSHLPAELGDVLSQIAPNWVPIYYNWLCSMERYSTAMSVFHAFLQTTDLSQQINAAIAGTAVDQESLKILEKRARLEHNGAQAVLAGLCDFLGPHILAETDARETSEEPLPKALAMNLDEYPPEHLQDFFHATKAEYRSRREEHVGEWFRHWVGLGRGAEAFRAIEIMSRTIDLGNSDTFFEFVLSNFGKEKAYPFLVKAQAQNYGWGKYWLYDYEANIRTRWSSVKRHYPDRWFAFIVDTIRSDRKERPWSGVSAHNHLARLVEYCFFMDQIAVGKSVADRSIEVVLQLVSPIPLGMPGWTRLCE